MSVEGEKTDVFLLSFWETRKWQWGEVPAQILVRVSGYPGGSARPQQVDQLGRSLD